MSSQQAKTGNHVTSRTVNNSAHNSDDQSSFMDQAYDVLSQPLVMIGVGVVTLASIGGGAYLFFFKKSPLEKANLVLKNYEDQASKLEKAISTIEGKIKEASGEEQTKLGTEKDQLTKDKADADKKVADAKDEVKKLEEAKEKKGKDKDGKTD